jgi:hypothetical protein
MKLFTYKIGLYNGKDYFRAIDYNNTPKTIGQFYYTTSVNNWIAEIYFSENNKNIREYRILPEQNAAKLELEKLLSVYGYIELQDKLRILL